MVAFSSLMIFVFFLFAYFYESNFGPIGILNFILSNVNFTVLMGFFFACLLGMRYRFSVYNECFEYFSSLVACCELLILDSDFL